MTSTTHTDPVSPPEPVTGPRGSLLRPWLGVITLLVVVTISYIDRTNTSVLITDNDFLAHFGLVGDRAAQGALMTFFLVGYGVAALLLTPFYETRLNVRSGLLISVGVWAAVTFASPWALGLPMLLVLRAVLGASEGPLFSLKTMFVRSEFPPEKWGKPNAVSSMGVSLGTAIGIPLVAFLIARFGWHGSFVAIALGNALIGLPLVWLFVRTRARAPRPADRPSPIAALRIAARTPNLVPILLIEVATLAFLWGMVAWLPAYLKEDRGFSLAQMGVLASVPFVVSLLSGFLGGTLIDRLRPALMPIVLVVGSLGAGVCTTVVVTTDSRIAAAVFLILANAFWGLQGPAIPTLVQRFARAGTVGTTYGVVNGVGNLFSAAMPAVMGLAIAGGGQSGFGAGFSLLIITQAITLVTAAVLIIRRRRPAATAG